MTSLEEETQAVFEILRSLSHTEFVYLLADLYSIRGWEVSLTTGDPKAAGDLVANQILPEPKSLAIYYYDSEGLSEKVLSERLDRLSQDKLIVIVDGGPSDEAISLSRRNPVSIIGVGDVAKEIVFSSTLDILRDHIPEESPLLDEYGGLFGGLPEQTGGDSVTGDDESADAEGGQSTDGRSDEAVGGGAPRTSRHTVPTSMPTLSEGAIGLEGEFFGIEYLGHDFVSGDDVAGTLLAVEVFAKEYNIEIWSEMFSVKTVSGYSYQAADGYDAPMVDQLVSDLPSVWRGNSRVSVPAGARVNILLFVDSSEPSEIGSVRYSHKNYHFFDMDREQMESQIECDSNYTFSVEAQISSSPSSNNQSQLPAEVRTQIENLGYSLQTAE